MKENIGTFDETILLSGNLCGMYASAPGGGSWCPT